MQSEKKYNIINESIRHGNEEVFNAFFMAEYDNIVFFVTKYINDPSSAQDIAQETFISLWNSREHLKPECSIRSYTFTIARNRALNFLRDTINRRTDPIVKREAAVNTIALESISVSEELEALELESFIEKMYRLLPEKVRDSFVLSRKFGMTYEEIATQKHVSVKVVEYHIILALRYLRKKLKEHRYLIP